MLSLLDATLLAHFVFKFDVAMWFWLLALVSEISNNCSTLRKLKALERIAGHLAPRAKE